jgi:tetratricopeptide (TPR) repeat protein
LEFKNAVRLAPGDAEPLYQMALAYLALGDGQAAVTHLMRASQLDPKHARVQLKLAELMALNTDRAVVEEAEKRAQFLLDASPDNPAAANALAVAEMRLGKTDNALAHLKHVLAHSPAFLSSAVNAAVIQRSKGDVKAAEQTLRQAAIQNPREPQARVVLGRLYLQFNRPQDAEREFRQALEIDPRNPPALLNLAAVQAQTGRQRDADLTYQSVAALPDHRFAGAHAAYLLEQHRFDSAIAELEALCRKHPADRDLRTMLAGAFVGANRGPEAERILNAALRKNPNDLHALEQRSELYLMEQKYSDAEKDLNRILHERPDSAQAHYALARLFRSQLRARQELSEAIRLDPNLAAARLDLAAFLTRHKDPHGALAVLDQAPAVQKNDVRFAIERNTALLALGRLPELRTSLDRSLAAVRSPELLLQDALLRTRLRDFDGARRSTNEVLRANPYDVRALEALSITYIAQGRNMDAIQTIHDHVTGHRSSAPELVFLGQLYAANARPAQARSALQQAVAADPAYLPGQLAMADRDAAEGKSEQARSRLKGLLAAHPQDAQLRLKLAMAEEATGRFEQAMEQYRATLDLDDSSVIALNNLAALLCERAHQPDQALRWAQKAREAAPDDPTVADTLGWIYFRQGLFASAMPYLKAAGRSNLRVAVPVQLEMEKSVPPLR